MRQSTAASLAAVCGVLLCTAVALPWYSRRSPNRVEQALQDADPSRRSADRRFEGWWFPPAGAGGPSLLVGAVSSVVAVLLAVRQDRLDDPAARRLAGIAAGGFGMATLFSAVRLAVGPEYLRVWGRAWVTPTSLALCLGAAAAATAFAVRAWFARRAAPSEGDRR